MTRTICIGDVHGCLEELDALLHLVDYRRDRDRLVLLGDLLDKGPDPVGVVRRAREIGAEAVLGNHDEKHLRWRRHEERRAADPGYQNPMKPLSPERLAQNANLSDDDIAWLRALPITLQLGEPSAPTIAVHGGFEPGLPLDQQRDAKMLRCRYVDADGLMVAISNDIDQPVGTRRWATSWREPAHAFYGHHCMKLGEPTIDYYEHGDGRIWLRCGLDGACCYGGRLLALVSNASGRNQSPPRYEIAGVPGRAYARLWMGDDA